MWLQPAGKRGRKLANDSLQVQRGSQPPASARLFARFYHPLHFRGVRNFHRCFVSTGVHLRSCLLHRAPMIRQRQVDVPGLPGPFVVRLYFAASHLRMWGRNLLWVAPLSIGADDPSQNLREVFANESLLLEFFLWSTRGPKPCTSNLPHKSTPPSCPHSLPEFMNFKLFGKTILVCVFFLPSTQPVSS